MAFEIPTPGAIRELSDEIEPAHVEQVHVDPETHTIAWPGEIDLDAAVLYGLYEPADGTKLQRRVIQPT